MIGIGTGINYGKVLGSLGQTIAQAHYDRVTADGGVLPIGVAGLASVLNTIAAAYNVSTTAAFNAAVPVFLDPHYTGYKLGTGSGTTLGQAARTVYAINSSADVTQATAASQPLLLAHSGANYWFSPRVDNNNCSTPSVSIDTASGMSVEAQVSFTTNDDANNSSGWICANDNGGINRNMFLGFSSSRTLIVYWANLTRSATATALIPAAYSGWIKASLETSGADMLAKFWTSPDGVTWTQLGSTITNAGGANTFQTAASPFYVTGNGTSNNIAGKIYRVIYRNASGTARADFNPTSYNAANSQTSWVSATSETWTINTGTATTGYKGCIVFKTIMQGDGVDDRLTSGTLTSRQYFTRFSALTPYNLTPSQYIISGNPLETHLIYKGSTIMNLYNTPSQITFSGISAYSLQLLTADFNGASSKARVNANADVTGTTGAATSTILNLFSSGSGSLFANSVINTVIDCSSVSNDTQKTEMYLLINSINGGALV